jgi:hypothetical protein
MRNWNPVLKPIASNLLLIELPRQVFQTSEPFLPQAAKGEGGFVV